MVTRGRAPSRMSKGRAKGCQTGCGERSRSCVGRDAGTDVWADGGGRIPSDARCREGCLSPRGTAGVLRRRDSIGRENARSGTKSPSASLQGAMRRLGPHRRHAIDGIALMQTGYYHDVRDIFKCAGILTRSAKNELGPLAQ